MVVAVTAFIITTGNSYLLSTSTNLVNDIYASLTRKQHTSTQFMWMTRCTIVVVGIAAYITGKLFPTVLEIQLFAYTMYGAVITPCLLAVFVSKRVTPAGAVSSMAVGIAATILWEFGLGTPNDWNSVLFSLPLEVVTLIVVSAFTKPLQPDRDRRPSAIRSAPADELSPSSVLLRDIGQCPQTVAAHWFALTVSTTDPVSSDRPAVLAAAAQGALADLPQAWTVAGVVSPDRCSPCLAGDTVFPASGDPTASTLRAAIRGSPNFAA